MLCQERSYGAHCITYSEAGRGGGSKDMSWRLFRSIYGLGEPIQLSISCAVRQRPAIFNTRLQVQPLVTWQDSHSMQTQAVVTHPLWYSHTPPPKWFTTPCSSLPLPPFSIRFIHTSNTLNLSNNHLQSTCVRTRGHSTLHTHPWRISSNVLVNRHNSCWHQQRRTYAKKGGMVNNYE